MASNDKDMIARLNGQYAGRASLSPIVDVFVTLLGLGKSGYTQLLESRQNSSKYN